MWSLVTSNDFTWGGQLCSNMLVGWKAAEKEELERLGFTVKIYRPRLGGVSSSLVGGLVDYIGDVP